MVLCSWTDKKLDIVKMVISLQIDLFNTIPIKMSAIMVVGIEKMILKVTW